MTSYNTLDSANVYFGNRLFTAAWSNAIPDNQQAALNQAYAIINKFQYVGIKTALVLDPTGNTPQDGEFPRSYIILEGISLDPNAIPEDILTAECEIAIALLKGIDPEMEIRGARITTRSLAGVRATYDSHNLPENIENGVPSAIAWSFLLQYFDTSHSRNIAVRRSS